MSNYILSGDRKWYYSLLGSNNETKKVKGLLEEVNIGNLNNFLIVCVQAKEDLRYFSIFESYLDFINHNAKIQPQYRTYYEIILGDRAQKPHFDLDFETTDGYVSFNDGVKLTPAEIVDLTIKSIIEVLREYNVTLNLEYDLCLYSSHGVNKYSYHIVITNYVHLNNKEAKAFYDLVVAKLPVYLINSKCVDNMVYSSKQQFRMLGSTKFGKNRFKTLISEFIVNGVNCTHKHRIDLNQYAVSKRAQILELTKMEESFVSNTVNCIYLPSFIKEEVKNMVFTNEIVLNNKIVLKAMTLLSRAMKCINAYNYFEVVKISGALIVLKKKSDYKCLICQRSHESENPFLRVDVLKYLFFHCRRKGMSVKLGLLDIEEIIVVEKVKKETEVDIENMTFGLTNFKPLMIQKKSDEVNEVNDDFVVDDFEEVEMKNNIVEVKNNENEVENKNNENKVENKNENDVIEETIKAPAIEEDDINLNNEVVNNKINILDEFKNLSLIEVIPKVKETPKIDTNELNINYFEDTENTNTTNNYYQTVENDLFI